MKGINKKSFWGDHARPYRPATMTLRINKANKNRPRGTVREIVYLDRVEIAVWR